MKGGENMKSDIREYGIKIGDLERGNRNNISDVGGVKVGHVTYDDSNNKTGLTVILPHEGNIFREKLIASSHVINGFGKSIGTIQIEELGSLETPIALTNTLSVGKVADGLIKYMLKDNRDIGLDTGTINPVVCECNDGHLNNIQNMIVGGEDILEAIKNADTDFKEGDVGAGTGMVCYGLKGGIGSSSRVIEIDGRKYTIGVLTLTNFGRMEDLRLDGRRVGNKIKEVYDRKTREDNGSIVVVLATDLPVSSRQLKRIIKRCYGGIISTGSFTSTGSGELVIGFSTGNRIYHDEEKIEINLKVLNENKINEVFKGAKEATEEAILSSLINSSTSIGRDGHRIDSINEYMDIVKNK